MPKIKLTFDYDEVHNENGIKKLIYLYKNETINFYQYLYHKSDKGFIIATEQTDGKKSFNG